jgi:hypothetical protein
MKAAYSNGSIDQLRDLLKYKVTINGKKVNAQSLPASNDKTGNVIHLFYNDDNETLKLGQCTEIGYFSTGVQVACRHSNNALCRQMAYSSIRYLNTQKNTIDGVFISMGIDAPSYQGIDETGNHVWVFTLKLKSQE